MATLDDRHDACVAHAARLSLLLAANVLVAVGTVRLVVVGPDAGIGVIAVGLGVLTGLAYRRYR